MKKRIENLEEELREIGEELKPLEETRQTCDQVLSLEPLSLTVSEYGEMFEDLKNLKKKRAEKNARSRPFSNFLRDR